MNPSTVDNLFKFKIDNEYATLNPLSHKAIAFKMSTQLLGDCDLACRLNRMLNVEHINCSAVMCEIK